MILFANPGAQYFSRQKEIDAAIQNVLASGNYILGEQVAQFENEFAHYLGVKNAIGVGNGTDALILALKSLRIGLGDEIILPAMTATATAAAVSQVGATPIFADIEKDYYTIDYQLVEKTITKKTKAMIAVHLYGQPAEMSTLQKIATQYRIKLIEDCAQAVGARYHEKPVGNFSDVACFSFFPTKNLGAVGDGGCVVTHDIQLAKRIRMLRQYGWDENRESQFPGVNSRLDELQAAILRVKLHYLDEDTKKRNALAAHYYQALKSLPFVLPKVRDHCFHAFHLYVMQCENRDRLIKKMREKNIIVGVHYPKAVHQMPAYFDPKIKLPIAENLSNHVISLPMYPELSFQQLELITQALEYVYERT